MNHHLVDHHLSEQRCARRKQLDNQRRDQHVAPDLLVFQQFGYEPFETEGGIVLPGAVGVVDGLAVQCELKDGAGETKREFGVGQRLRGIAAGFKQDHVFGVDLHHDGWACCTHRSIRNHVDIDIGGGRCRLAVHDGQAGEIQACYGGAGAILALDAEPERAARVDDGVGAIGRRELADQQAAVERFAVEGAKAAHRPDDIVDRECVLHRGLRARVRETRRDRA